MMFELIVKHCLDSLILSTATLLKQTWNCNCRLLYVVNLAFSLGSVLCFYLLKYCFTSNNTIDKTRIIFLCRLVFLMVTDDVYYEVRGEFLDMQFDFKLETVKPWASNPLLRAGLRAALGKITISGTLYRLNDCVIFMANT